MSLRQLNVDFNTISRALSYSIEAVQEEELHDRTALDKLIAAQKELQRALSFSLSYSSR
jgi:hypothetical protein